MEGQKVKIERLVSGGYGLGYLDGRVIFVPYSAPGDELIVEVVSKRKGVLWGHIKQIKSPSVLRATPFCAHYKLCGGCQLQHISYTAQLEQKRLMLADTLSHLAGLKDIAVKPCLASPINKGYRRRVRLHCSAGEIGFYKPQSHTITPIDNCPILTLEINDCLKQLSNYPALHSISGLSEIRLMQGDGGQLIMSLKMDYPPSPAVINKFRDNIGVAGAVLSSRGRDKILWGRDYAAFSMQDFSFRVSAGAFFQANTSLLPGLIKQLLKALKFKAVDSAVELYAGVGVFSLPLAEKVNKLITVEWNKKAVRNALFNLGANRVKNVIVYPVSAGEGLELLYSKKLKPGLVLVDPPREGLSDRVCQRLKQLAARQIIYVSCNPASLARDMKRIMSTGAYQLSEIQPLDMFPHTAHIESVSILVKK